VKFGEDPITDYFVSYSVSDWLSPLPPFTRTQHPIMIVGIDGSRQEE